jgi:hypothetical protein
MAQSIGGADLASVVLTMPPGERGDYQHISWRMCKTLRKLAWRVVQAWAFLTWGGRIGGYVAVHPAGDRCRCGHDNEVEAAVQGRCGSCGEETKYRPHFHVGFPLVVEIAGKPRTVRGWVNPESLERLRELWAGVLDQVSGDPCVTANVHYSYHSGASKVGHRLRYDLRTWPAWSAISQEAASILRVTRYGLAAGNSKAPAWKGKVKGPELAPSGDGAECTCKLCGDTARYSYMIPMSQLDRSVRMVYQWEGDNYEG